jgi:hypothetical protein
MASWTMLGNRGGAGNRLGPDQRRLLETLIIEGFENNGIANKIQNAVADFVFLSDMIDRTLNETSWNLSRKAKSAMPKLKDVGNKSAHSRRFNAF